MSGINRLSTLTPNEAMLKINHSPHKDQKNDLKSGLGVGFLVICLFLSTQDFIS